MESVKKNHPLYSLAYSLQLYLQCFVITWVWLFATESFAQAADNPAPQDRKSALMEMLVKKANELSKKDYVAANSNVPESLKNLSYDQYRSIRFNPDKAMWRNESLFELQLFHPGFLYTDAVALQLVDGQGMTQGVPFDNQLFIYRDNKTAELAAKAIGSFAYSGFRVHYPINKQTYKDEIAVFQGASYFRLVGPGQVYGLSARGLAVDTAEPSGEEFPRFTDFWLVKPAPDETDLTLFALLDSPSVTGAYRFTLTPGTATVMSVEVVLFARKDIKKIGMAPLTSMFFHGEANNRHLDDYRNEIHDSDGLLMHTADDQWIWRPLSNPKSLQITSMVGRNPKGFGLVQRDRDFDHYLDAESRFEDRPSMWITPRGEWGEGRVELVEIPSDSETNDNIVAYWVPAEPLKAGQQKRFSYELRTFNNSIEGRDQVQVKRTLIGWGAIPGHANPPPKNVRRFAIDFTGTALKGLSDDMPVKAKLEKSSGAISEITTTRLHGDKGWRVSFKLKPENEMPVDMRLYLELRGTKISEEWSYVWNPNIIE